MLGVAAILAVMAAAPATPPVVQHAQACITAHAGEVVTRDRSLDSAAAFLVNYLCATEVEAASRYLRNRQLVDLLAGSSPNAGKIVVDVETGYLHMPAEPGKGPTDGLGAVNVLQSAFPIGVAPQLRTFAAEAVLQTRPGARP